MIQAHSNGEASSLAQNWFRHHQMKATNESEPFSATSSQKNSKTVLSQLSWKNFNQHTIACKVSSRTNVSDPGQIDALKAHRHNKPSNAELLETSPRQAHRSDTFEKASLSQNVAQQTQGKTAISKQHRQCPNAAGRHPHMMTKQSNDCQRTCKLTNQSNGKSTCQSNFQLKRQSVFQPIASHL